MKLSIIIPVYHTQDTLARCIDSILQQSFIDYEIILVDDESPDESPMLCDKYAQKHENIKVIHKRNGGLSDARNAGIEKAKGEYITFIDSDDAMQKGSLLPLMKELDQHPNVDILEYPIWERLGHSTREHLLTFSPYTYDNPSEYWLSEDGFKHTYACNKIFRRTLFDYIRFPKGKNFEDVLTIPLLLGLNKSSNNTKMPHSIIRVTNTGGYCYYWNSHGITANAKYEDLYNLYQGHSQTLKYILQEIGRHQDLLEKYSISLQDFMTQILNVLLDLYELSGKYESKPPLINDVKTINKRVKITSYKLKLLNLLGYHTLCKMNKLVHKFHRRNK